MKGLADAAIDHAISTMADHDNDPIAALVAQGVAGDESEALAPLGRLYDAFERRWGRWPTPEEQYGLVVLGLCTASAMS